MPFDSSIQVPFPTNRDTERGAGPGAGEDVPLRRVYFAEASGKDLDDLMKMRSIQRFHDGQAVPLNEAGTEGLYYIHSGYVKVTYGRWNQTEVIRIVGAHDLVGHARWCSRDGRYEMVALSEVVASCFRKEDFLNLQERSVYIANEVLRWLTDLLATQEQRLLSMRGRTAKERVAGSLDTLRKRFGRAIGCGGSLMSAPIDRKTLADFSGVAVEVLSRVLGELENENIIARHGRIIVIVDVKGLERVAGN